MSLTNAFIRIVYSPLCRVYARRMVGDQPADVLMTFLASFHFWMVHGYWPQFRNPRSFEEKVNCRMLFDRNPLWTQLSDKLLMRAFVEERVGGGYLVPLLWRGRNPEQIPFDALPTKFVLKTNHGCGYNIIVPDKSRLDLVAAKRQLQRWLGENFCTDTWLGTSWAYKNIKPFVLAEHFLDDCGRVPADYKFFCFSGRVEFIQVNLERFADHSEMLLDREFRPAGFSQNGIQPYGGRLERPKELDEMVAVAERLACGFNFIRVDLYNVGGRIYCGELTCYPGAGSTRFSPRGYDFAIGRLWKNQ